MLLYYRNKRDAIEGKTFLDFNTKGGNEETQELSSILRLFDISEQRYLYNFLFQCSSLTLICYKMILAESTFIKRMEMDTCSC